MPYYHTSHPLSSGQLNQTFALRMWIARLHTHIWKVVLLLEERRHKKPLPPRRPIASIALHCWKSRIPHRPSFLSLYSRSASFQGYGAMLASFASRTKQFNSRQDTTRLWANERMLSRRWFLCANHVPPHGEAGGALGQKAPRAADHKCKTAFRLGWTHSFSWKEPIVFSFGALYRVVHGSRPQREKTCWKYSLTKSRSANALRLSECVEKQITIQAVSGIVPAQRASSKRNAPVLPLPW